MPLAQAIDALSGHSDDVLAIAFARMVFKTWLRPVLTVHHPWVVPATNELASRAGASDASTRSLNRDGSQLVSGREIKHPFLDVSYLSHNIDVCQNGQSQPELCGMEQYVPECLSTDCPNLPVSYMSLIKCPMATDAQSDRDIPTDQWA
jgi:hypothetical protein